MRPGHDRIIQSLYVALWSATVRNSYHDIVMPATTTWFFCERTIRPLIANFIGTLPATLTGQSISTSTRNPGGRRRSMANKAPFLLMFKVLPLPDTSTPMTRYWTSHSIRKRWKPRRSFRLVVDVEAINCLKEETVLRTQIPICCDNGG